MSSFNKKVMGLLAVSLFSFASSVYADGYGAIYYNKNTGIAGISSEQPSVKSAKNAALKSCIKQHEKIGAKPQCKYFENFKKACVTLAFSPAAVIESNESRVNVPTGAYFVYNLKMDLVQRDKDYLGNASDASAIEALVQCEKNTKNNDCTMLPTVCSK